MTITEPLEFLKGTNVRGAFKYYMDYVVVWGWEFGTSIVRGVCDARNITN